ncbi:hypothetical protein PACTADRAFT_51454 [Pachysolen tannophilus NRRL Y-2460]|uniref:Ca3427-like PBP 2 domain-containing protein n=1 Tax=Pachysolen tannophilus NRRL Y-2460 TaxID=669874 RepID=A0A1E4TPP5_PACTA|nr:hypothetical protein PACTADRAFT_51454 [Pachysolen tannophilus NRRL Y-2460]
MVLKVGFVPEHFSTPIQFAKIHGFFTQKNLQVELIPFLSGSGHLIQCLKSQEIDIAIGLTEAFVRGICDGDTEYKISGTYVESPLCWSISTGSQREDITSCSQLNGKKISVSRIGSGSYVMPFVLALNNQFQKPFYSGFPAVSTFANLRDSVNLVKNIEPSDAFMWEFFTSKKYYDNGEIKKIGEIYTPWPSWVIVSSSKLIENEPLKLKEFLIAIQEGIDYFNDHKEEAVDYIGENLDYSKEDAIEWMKTVKFSNDVKLINYDRTVLNTSNILRTAGVIQKNGETNDLISKRLETGIFTQP